MTSTASPTSANPFLIPGYVHAAAVDEALVSRVKSALLERSALQAADVASMQAGPQAGTIDFVLTSAAALATVQAQLDACNLCVAHNAQVVCVSATAEADCVQGLRSCASSPCQHNGLCVPLAQGYECACSADWTGATCQIPARACQKRPCFNLGQCATAANQDGYTCTCRVLADGKFTGSRCEDFLPDILVTSPSSSSSSSSLNAGVAGAVVVFIVALVLVLILARRGQRRRQQTATKHMSQTHLVTAESTYLQPSTGKPSSGVYEDLPESENPYDFVGDAATYLQPQRPGAAAYAEAGPAYDMASDAAQYATLDAGPAYDVAASEAAYAAIPGQVPTYDLATGADGSPVYDMGTMDPAAADGSPVYDLGTMPSQDPAYDLAHQPARDGQEEGDVVYDMGTAQDDPAYDTASPAHQGDDEPAYDVATTTAADDPPYDNADGYLLVGHSL